MAPPAPLASKAWDQLGLTITDSVNGHIESEYSLQTGSWSKPTFVADPYLRIHGLSPALNYGMQCYEGLKASRTTSGAITIFRPEFHARRMAHSASVVSMPEPPESLFMECITLAVQRNAEFVGPHASNAVLYIRPLLFGSGPQLALEPPQTFTFAVFVQPATTYHGIQPLPCLVLEDFDRAATRGTGHAKIGGNYAPTMLHSRAAKQAGFYVTLHLDSATQSEIDEFSTSGFIGVKKPEDTSSSDSPPTLVIPDSKQVINSVTSDSLTHLAKSLGWTVEKRRIPYSELSTFSEVLAVGTAASVLPIAAIVRKSTADKFVYCPDAKAGPVCLELGRKFKQILRAEKSEDQFGWIYEVPFPDEKKKLAKLRVSQLQTNGEGGAGMTEEELAMCMSPL